MKAIRIQTYGGVDVLEFSDVTRPNPGEGEVIIRSQASSVNPFDTAARAGYVAGYFQYEIPHILGLDVAGVVEECGPGVTGFAPGDIVFGRTNPMRNGAYAEYVVAHASEIAHKPKSLDVRHSAALAHVSLTAWTVVEMAGLSAGQTVCIHAAAGGVGHIAVQFAKMRGAHVIGTASARNHEFLKELGVDEVVDYTAAPFETVIKDVDAVFDLVGWDTLERSYQIVKPGGILLSTVQAPDETKLAAHGIRGSMVAAGMAGGALLEKFAALVDAGQLKVTVSSTLPLSEIRQAHTMMEGRHTRGKMTLDIGS